MVIIMYIKEVLSSVIPRVVQEHPSAVVAFLLGFLVMWFVSFTLQQIGLSSRAPQWHQETSPYGVITLPLLNTSMQMAMQFYTTQIRVGMPLVSIPGPLRVRL